MGLNDNIESPCELTRDWGVIGYLEDGTRFPIGVYTCWATARLAGNSWLKSIPKADRWEAERLYLPLTTPAGADA